MNSLPQARNSDVVVQALDKELLVYDLKTHEAYTLNETSMIVFNACNGTTTFAELKVAQKLTDDIIYLALDLLKKQNLLEENSAYVSPFAGISRREVIRKVGLASMITLPVIAALAAPTAAGAASTTRAANGQTCSTAQSGSSRQCLSGYCVQTSDGDLRCCTKQSSEAGTPNVMNDILGPPVATCNQRIASSCCSGMRATQFGQLCVCA